jgi:hypothetical protein
MSTLPKAKAADFGRRLFHPLRRRLPLRVLSDSSPTTMGVAPPQLKDESSPPVVLVSMLAGILPLFTMIAVGVARFIGLAI